MSKAVNTDTTDLPRPNIAKLIDDGTNSQLVLELEADVDNAVISHTYTEYDNITNLNIINRKIPTVIIVNGNGVNGTFTHDSAITALDRTYLEVNNNNLRHVDEKDNQLDWAKDGTIVKRIGEKGLIGELIGLPFVCPSYYYLKTTVHNNENKKIYFVQIFFKSN